MLFKPADVVEACKNRKEELEYMILELQEKMVPLREEIEEIDQFLCLTDTEFSAFFKIMDRFQHKLIGRKSALPIIHGEKRQVAITACLELYRKKNCQPVYTEEVLDEVILKGYAATDFTSMSSLLSAADEVTSLGKRQGWVPAHEYEKHMAARENPKIAATESGQRLSEAA